MYNSRIKTNFIQSFTSSTEARRIAASLFNATEPYEKEHGADICTFSSDELGSILSSFGGVRTNGVLTWVRILRAYSNWCAENGIVSETDATDHIVVDHSMRIRRSMVSGPKHLSQVLGSVLHDPSEQSTDDITASYLWLSFSGFMEEDMLSLTDHDIDFDTMTITYCDDTYPVYEEAKPSLFNCATLTSFYSISSRRRINTPRASGDQLLRGIAGPASIQKLRVMLVKKVAAARNNNSVPSLSAAKVWLSGVFYRIYERELAGVPADFALESVSNDIKRRIETTSGNKTKASIKHSIKQYKDDYYSWRRAFGLFTYTID